GQAVATDAGRGGLADRHRIAGDGRDVRVAGKRVVAVGNLVPDRDAGHVRDARDRRRVRGGIAGGIGVRTVFKDDDVGTGRDGVGPFDVLLLFTHAAQI